MVCFWTRSVWSTVARTARGRSTHRRCSTTASSSCSLLTGMCLDTAAAHLPLLTGSRNRHIHHCCSSLHNTRSSTSEQSYLVHHKIPCNSVHAGKVASAASKCRHAINNAKGLSNQATSHSNQVAAALSSAARAGLHGATSSSPGSDG